MEVFREFIGRYHGASAETGAENRRIRPSSTPLRAVCLCSAILSYGLGESPVDRIIKADGQDCPSAIYAEKVSFQRVKLKLTFLRTCANAVRAIFRSQEWQPDFNDLTNRMEELFAQHAKCSPGKCSEDKKELKKMANFLQRHWQSSRTEAGRDLEQNLKQLQKKGACSSLLYTCHDFLCHLYSNSRNQHVKLSNGGPSSQQPSQFCEIYESMKSNVAHHYVDRPLIARRQ